jgi:hypothetical protein
MHSLLYKSQQFSYGGSNGGNNLAWTQTVRSKMNNFTGVVFSRGMSFVLSAFPTICCLEETGWDSWIEELGQ